MRESIPAADALLDKQVPVLDHGFVALTNYMGSDAEICRAARTCTSGEGTKTTSDDRALIRRLMRDNHTSPFEFVEMTFLCQMPIFVARQWIRHRTANVNEMSGRYGELPELTYVPEPERISWQNPVNKQGSGDAVPATIAEWFRDSLEGDMEAAFETYHEFLGRRDDGCLSMVERQDLIANGGISRELARINLPLSTYTKWKWKIDLHNLLHFLELRLHLYAQWEIRQYARAMAEMVQALCPLAWEAFEDFRLNAVTLSGSEILAIRAIVNGETNPVFTSRFSKSEFSAFLTKLADIGMQRFIPDATNARLSWESISTGVGGNPE